MSFLYNFYTALTLKFSKYLKHCYGFEDEIHNLYVSDNYIIVKGMKHIQKLFGTC